MDFISKVYYKLFSIFHREKKTTIEYFRKVGVRIGNNVEFITPPKFASEPYLVSIGDNTTISFDVAFITHDAATRVIRNFDDGNPETVIYGTISVGKNCFIGCRTTILANVNIGDNNSELVSRTFKKVTVVDSGELN